MGERLTDDELLGIARRTGIHFGFVMTEKTIATVPSNQLAALLTEVRDRRAEEAEEAAFNAEENAELAKLSAMSKEETDAELKAAGIDVTLWASSTRALVKACVERNEAVTRVAQLEAILSKVRSRAHEAYTAFDECWTDADAALKGGAP